LTRALRPRNLALAGGLLLLVTVVLLVLLSSDAFLDIPAPAQPLAPLVHTSGGKPIRDGGGIYYVAVTVRRATLLEKVFPPARPDGSTLDNAGLGPCTTDAQETEAQLRAMQNSQRTAEAVAYRELGLRVRAKAIGLRVLAVDPKSHAVCKLRYADVIVAADGRRVRRYDDLRNIVKRHRPGQTVRIMFVRGRRRTTASIKTVADRRDPKQALIGILLREAYSFRLPRHARFDLGRVGGPSAGLAFALELLEKSGRDVDRGHRVAATGELLPDGTVTQIGGVKQKVIGARRAHVDVFLVPADGQNASEARRYAHGLRIVPVKSFQQALRALATLPTKH
jgi:PDZ domain-containing protein